MSRYKPLPIVAMAYGGNTTKKGLITRRKLLMGADLRGTSGTAPVSLAMGGEDNPGWGSDEELGIAPAAKKPLAPKKPTDWAGLDRGVSDTLLPFASNIVNSLRTPPQPAAPHLVSPVTLSRIRLDASRQQARNTTRAQDINADKTLDEQSAAAVRSSNLAKQLNQEGMINEQEAFLNARQRAEAAGMNLNVDAMNTAALNKEGDERVQRQLAIQREQSQNLANATDKAIGMQNERAKAELDLQKLNTLSQMWRESGVYNRLRKRMAAEGMKDPTGIGAQLGNLGDLMDDADTATKAMGGTIQSPLQGKHPTKAGVLHRRRIGDHKVMAVGGEGPGKQGFTTENIIASKNSGIADADLADKINQVLVTGNMPSGGVDPQYRNLYLSAYIWRQQHAGASPEDRISSWYGRDVNPNNAEDMLRGRLRNINLSPVANYHTTPSQNAQMRQGVAATPVIAGVGNTEDLINKTGFAFGGYRSNLAKGYLSPFGNTRSIGLGPGIARDRFNPKHISHVPHNMLAMGGAPKTDGSAGDDLTWTNYGDATPDVYRMGGPWQEEWKHGGRLPLHMKTVDHSMWKQPYKENALTNNDPNPYQTGSAMAMGGMAGEFSGTTTEQDMSMWNRKQWMDEHDPGTDIYAHGGGIHIKPSHRGRFTEYKRRTGKTTEEALHSKDPHVRQMANFARNARKWHHATGGMLSRGLHC